MLQPAGCGRSATAYRYQGAGAALQPTRCGRSATAYRVRVRRYSLPGVGAALQPAGCGRSATAYLMLEQGLRCCIERGATAVVADVGVARLEQLTQAKVCKGRIAAVEG